jgi:hypothetical protein
MKTESMSLSGGTDTLVTSCVDGPHSARANRRLAQAVRWLTLVAVVLGMACDRDDLPTRPAASPHAFRTQSRGRVRPAVAYLDSISASVPEFGGYFLDGQRHLVVYVTDTMASPRARGVVAAEILHHRIRDKAGEYRPTIIFRKGDYGFSQLQDWADALSDNVMGKVPGVISSGVDIKTNRVRLGITQGLQANAQSSVLQSLTGLGIPQAAVTIETEQTAVSGPRGDLLDATLLWRRDHVNLAMRGRETEGASFLTTTLSSSPFNPWLGATIKVPSDCTGTLAVDYTPSGGSQQRYIMVASHCTSAWASLTADTIFNGGGVSVLGTEAFDPPEPRYSDMALYLVNASATVPRGTIARTFLGGSTTNIDTSNPPISVIGHVSSEVVGNYVMKVGVAGGWTDGYIDAINQTKMGNDSHNRYGTTVADYASEEGDSGAPVFWPEGSDAADFEGISWAKYSRTCGLGQTCYGSYYSPISGILSDLGASASQFNFTTSITMTSPSLSGSVTYSSSCGHTVPVLTWTSSSVSGTSWPVSYLIYGEDFYGDGTSSGQYLVATLGAGTTTYQPCNWISTYLGGSPPGPGYSYTSYFVDAYDSGVQVYSYLVYFE